MDLSELYRDVIVDHNRSPRNRGRLPDACRHAEGNNPLCGDRLHLDIDLAGELIRDLLGLEAQTSLPVVEYDEGIPGPIHLPEFHGVDLGRCGRGG